MIRLYLLKCLHSWSNTSFTFLLELLKEEMPDVNIHVSFYKTKAMISGLGLDYKKIHACQTIACYFGKSMKRTILALFVKLHGGKKMLQMKDVSLRNRNMIIEFLHKF